MQQSERKTSKNKTELNSTFWNELITNSPESNQDLF